MGKTVDLTGEVFGRLRVIKRMASVGHNATWLCKCECGRDKRIRADLLTRDVVQSCGCYQRECAAKLLRIHGKFDTPEWRIWDGMIRRCYTPTNGSYRNYGARGIRVCERWRNSFENFYADMGARPSSKHSLDRIDGDGPYSPANCRWVTPYTQNRNHRRNRIVEIDGVSLCVTDWCTLMEVSKHRPYEMLYYNKRTGIKTVEEALRILYNEYNARHL